MVSLKAVCPRVFEMCVLFSFMRIKECISRIPTQPYGSKDPNNRALGPKYH